MNKNEKKTTAFHAIMDLIFKIILGLVISFGLIILDNLIYLWLGRKLISDVFIQIMVISVSLYLILHHYHKYNFWYIVGWILGIYFFVKWGWIEEIGHALLYIFIPTIIYIIRYIIDTIKG